ncbi:MAG: acyl-CoA thioesterase [Acidimicrobiia bacterium]
MKAFERETAVVRDVQEHPGTQFAFRGELSEEWCALAVPQGGIVAGVAARAMAGALDAPELALRSITSVFAAPVRTGPVEVDVTVLRRGRSMAQATATVRSEGESAGTTAIAVFGSPRVGFAFTDLAFPDAPAPEDSPSFRDGPPPEIEDRSPFAYWQHHVEGRAAVGHAPWEEFESTSSERMFWYRFDDPPHLEDGRLDPLALLTLCDTMPGAVGERMGGGLPEWWAPSADLTVHLLGDHRAEWVLARNRARHAGDGYASLEVELWDAEMRTLSAYATQLMIFTFPEGPPPLDLRVPRDLR